MNKGVQFDDVDLRGQIVGGDYLVGNLYYEGRPQGCRIFARSCDEIVSAGSARLEEMRAEIGEAFRMIYPGGNWTVRIFQ